MAAKSSSRSRRRDRAVRDDLVDAALYLERIIPICSICRTSVVGNVQPHAQRGAQIGRAGFRDGKMDRFFKVEARKQVQL